MASGKGHCERAESPSRAADQLCQLKQKLKANLELIALGKFPKRIEKMKKVRKFYSAKCDIASAKVALSECVIPVPDPLQANLSKLKAVPDSVPAVLSLNPKLQCNQLKRIPVLLKKCKMPRNKAICELVEKIMPHLNDLDKDLNLILRALMLMFPKMREGEYFGIDLLNEVTESVQNMHAAVQSKVRYLMQYNCTRHELLKSAISHGHIEDYRLKVTRYDRSFCMKLQQALDYAYMAYVLVYVLVKKNRDKLSEFSQMDELESKEIDNMYS